MKRWKIVVQRTNEKEIELSGFRSRRDAREFAARKLWHYNRVRVQAERQLALSYN